jgi:mRNA interferase RelE/StbE
MTDGWRWEFTPHALRDWRAAPPDIRRRVVEALDRIAADRTSRHVRKLRGREDEWRLRVGGWRVRLGFDDDRQTIVVLRVQPRGRAYRG